MAKLSKRQRNKQKQKQLKSKRNWSLQRTSKRRKANVLYNNKSSSSDKNGHGRIESEQEPDKTVSSRSAKRLASCLIKSLSNTASKPVHFLCTCMVLCNHKIHASLDVVNRGKQNVHSAISYSMANGYSKIKTMVGYVGDTVFPMRPYKRKLDEISSRLEEVERELKRLKRDVTDNSSHHPSSTMTLPSVSSGVPAPPSLPPPPPPPPPPPVCKPPPVITFKKKKASKQDEKSSDPATNVCISLEQLTSVKLRKITRVEKQEKENIPASPVKFGLRKRSNGKFVSPSRGVDANNHPFITLKDIRKVSLRKTQTNGNSAKKRSPSRSQIAFLRHNLRKVENKRSPGGTPANNKPQQCFGDGLTPIMTRALQKKFKFANPPSPLDSFNETKSFMEKSFTQTSPCSPLTRLQAMR
ncbi:proline-rich protein 11-like [Dendronephthya gigantea]|uniref:proline-rich protein 11-like n=1 Tax=Dendronephthya gigantea TaxID=151771 RepID=UPI001069F256|nr:proline-rich protein 11-like [Dendronephthya gigantea]